MQTSDTLKYSKGRAAGAILLPALWILLVLYFFMINPEYLTELNTKKISGFFFILLMSIWWASIFYRNALKIISNPEPKITVNTEGIKDINGDAYPFSKIKRIEEKGTGFRLLEVPGVVLILENREEKFISGHMMEFGQPDLRKTIRRYFSGYRAAK